MQDKEKCSEIKKISFSDRENVSSKELNSITNQNDYSTSIDSSIPLDLSTKPKIHQPDFPPSPSTKPKIQQPEFPLPPPLSESYPSPKLSPRSPKTSHRPNSLSPTSPKKLPTCHLNSYSPLKHTTPLCGTEFSNEIVKYDKNSFIENAMDSERTFSRNPLKPITSEFQMNFSTAAHCRTSYQFYPPPLMPTVSMFHVPLVEPNSHHADYYINSSFAESNSAPLREGGQIGGSQEASKSRLLPIHSQQISISSYYPTTGNTYEKVSIHSNHKDILKEKLKENSFKSICDRDLKAEPFSPILRLDGGQLDKESNVSHYTPLVSNSTGTPSSIQAPSYFCSACNKSYATYSGLARHKLFYCSTLKKKSFTCERCQKAYVSLGALKMHIRTHTLPCKCDICGKAFSRKWLLRGHIRTHTGEKPFSCTHCNTSFADRSNLRAHLQTQSEVKKYCCGSCNKTFSRMSLLTKHNNGRCGTRSSFTISHTP